MRERDCEADGEPSRALTAPDPSGKQKLYWDDEPKGFGVLCRGVTRTKTFILQRAVNGKTRRITIAPVLGVAGEVEEARSKAREKLSNFFYKGIDPKADPSWRHAPQGAGGLSLAETLRPRSASSYRDAVERNLRDWLDRPLAEITPTMVLERHAELTENNGRAVADGTMRVLRARLQQRELPLHRREPAAEPGEAEGQLAPAAAGTGHVRAEELPALLPSGDGAGLARSAGI